MALPDVDGALVGGGASLRADSFLKLVFYDKQ
jgi:triosephosphate isomerase